MKILYIGAGLASIAWSPSALRIEKEPEEDQPGEGYSADVCDSGHGD
jgi:hypothetical protein